MFNLVFGIRNEAVFLDAAHAFAPNDSVFQTIRRGCQFAEDGLLVSAATRFDLVKPKHPMVGDGDFLFYSLFNQFPIK